MILAKLNIYFVSESLFKDTGSFPKYAYCQHIKFTLGLFRDITYELLPFNQRKEFHERAISYLQKQEHICASCERVSFPRHISMCMVVMYEI